MRHMPGPDATVDTPFGHSVSFAPPVPSRHVPASGSWGSVAVGPVRHADPLVHGAAGDRMNGYPIQPAKVQRPPLRAETLAPGRLLRRLAAHNPPPAMPL